MQGTAPNLEKSIAKTELLILVLHTVLLLSKNGIEVSKSENNVNSRIFFGFRELVLAWSHGPHTS